jgi:hypothetical protein
MTALAITPAEVRIVRLDEALMLPDGPTNEAVNAGQPVRFDTTTGKYTKANGTDAAEALVRGISVTTVGLANLTISVMQRGYLDVGDALDALNPGVPIYMSDTDGTLSDSAGDSTVDVIVGRVVMGWGNTAGDKLLFVDIP